MEKIVVFRSLCRAACFRSSSRFAAAAAASHSQHLGSRSFFSFPPSSASNAARNHVLDSRSPYIMSMGGIRYFSQSIDQMLEATDPQVQRAFKDLMAVSWDNLPESVVHGAKKALSQSTTDKAAQDILKNVFCAAEAVEEFSGILNSLKMEIDDSIGLSGEDVKPIPDGIANALQTVFVRYSAYLDAFGPDEFYLRKKVEAELGTKMIHLKMRCSGLGSEWEKVTVLGTSGLAGSFVEKRA